MLDGKRGGDRRSDVSYAIDIGFVLGVIALVTDENRESVSALEAAAALRMDKDSDPLICGTAIVRGQILGSEGQFKAALQIDLADIVGVIRHRHIGSVECGRGIPPALPCNVSGDGYADSLLIVPTVAAHRQRVLAGVQSEQPGLRDSERLFRRIIGIKLGTELFNRSEAPIGQFNDQRLYRFSLRAVYYNRRLLELNLAEHGYRQRYIRPVADRQCEGIVSVTQPGKIGSLKGQPARGIRIAVRRNFASVQQDFLQGQPA